MIPRKSTLVEPDPVLTCMYAHNVLITNVCNQNCTFCFASDEMRRGDLIKEMDFEDFKQVLRKIARVRSEKIVKLLGGEPTLHSRLLDFVDYSIKHAFRLQIFTNGIIAQEKINELSLYKGKIEYVFNITTRAFLHNQKVRRRIIDTIKKLCWGGNSTLSITVEPGYTYEYLKEIVELYPLVESIRIGPANPVVHGPNSFSFADFALIGSHIAKTIRAVRKLGFTKHIKLNCGLTRCMFSDAEYAYVKKQLPSLGWSCFGKESAFDIAVDKKAFHCLPFSNKERVDVTKYSLSDVEKKLVKKHLLFWSKQKRGMCLHCPHYGFGNDKCPGPCLAFQMNQERLSNG